MAILKLGKNCLHELNKLTLVDEGILLRDTMRLFHGDGPAVQLESGNQKGGHYFCPTCDIHACQIDDISYRYQLKSRSFTDIQQKVISGKYGKKYSIEGKCKPFAQLSSKEIKEELVSRDVSTKKTPKKILKKS